MSDWPGPSQVITQDPVAVAGAVMYRLALAVAAARVEGIGQGRPPERHEFTGQDRHWVKKG